MTMEIKEVESPDADRRAFVVGAAVAGAAVFASTGPAVAGDPSPQPSSRVSVLVPPEAFGNLGRMQEITKNILGRLGCLACHSGFIIDWRLMNERLLAVDPRSLKITERQF